MIAIVVLLVAVAGCSARMEPDRTLHGSSPSNTLAGGEVTRGEAPPATGGTTAPAGVRQTVYGRVTDVDRNEIRVKIEGESFEVKMNDPKGAGIRKGDNVQIDMTFSPTSPSAMPRR